MERYLSEEIFQPLDSKAKTRSLYLGLIGLVIFTIYSIIIIIRTFAQIREFENFYSSLGMEYSPNAYWVTIILTIVLVWQVIIFYFLIYVYGVYKLKYILKEDELIIKFGLIKKKVPYGWILKVFNSPKGYFDPRPTWRRYSYIDPQFYVHKYKCDVDGAINKVTFYSTSLDDIVIFLIITEKGKAKYYGISPKNKSEFIEQIAKHDVEIKHLKFDDDE